MGFAEDFQRFNAATEKAQRELEKFLAPAAGTIAALQEHLNRENALLAEVKRRFAQFTHSVHIEPLPLYKWHPGPGSDSGTRQANKRRTIVRREVKRHIGFMPW